MNRLNILLLSCVVLLFIACDQTIKTKTPDKTTGQIIVPPTTKASNWKTFTHSDFSFSIDLPNDFKESFYSVTGTQIYRTDEDNSPGVAVEIKGPFDSTLFNKDYKDYLADAKGISYKSKKDNWFVVSGKDKNTEGKDEFYYHKMIVLDSIAYLVMFNYPPSKKELMDSIIPTITQSFKHIRVPEPNRP